MLVESDTTSVCRGRGRRYYSAVVDGKTNEDAAWYYPDPKKPAEDIRGHVAFWKGVEVSR